MTFVSYARWGRCRAAALSPWSRRVNLLLRAHRGLAGAPLLRAAAEHRPLMGFAEQSPVASRASTEAARVLGGSQEEGSDLAKAIQAAIAGSDSDVILRRIFSEMMESSIPKWSTRY
mmetsp:Transcript_79895/g.223589  ORF Transcript_79895/g.223589 Transcript_79895/m.223589 type:complete len:117 (-) Transcript_79895:115-465(-)